MKKLLVFLLFLLGYCTAYSQESLNTIIPAEPLTTYSTLWGFLYNVFGQMGDGTNVYRGQPLQISTDNWKTVAGGISFTLGLKSDGSLWAWGSNSHGQYGNGTVGDSSKIPLLIGKEKDWVFVTAGENCSFAIKNDGSLWAWGYNNYGQLGDSTEINRFTPVQIGKNIIGSVKLVSNEYWSTAIINNEGSLWTWGSNEYGQIGDGTNIDKSYPVKIGNSGEWQTVSCGQTHTIAIKTNGTLWAWGSNRGGLGDGTKINKNSPIQIGKDNDWEVISTSGSNNFAIKKNGTLWAWGWNVHGELGDGTMEIKNIPVQIGKDNDWLMVNTRWHSSEGIKKDGSLWLWGTISEEYTYDLDTILIPTKISNMNNIIQLSESGGSAFFIRNYLAIPAQIETSPITNITSYSAESGGNITSPGSEIIYQRGICYGFKSNPTIEADLTEDGTDVGEFQSSMKNLIPFKKYFVRAYVRTAAGDSYGETERMFTKLLTPILISPQQSAMDITLKSDFIWKKDINALKYRFQLSKYADFSKFERDIEVVDSTININDLELNYNYYWRVQTINGVYLSDWSEINSFHTIKFNNQQLLMPIENAINIPIDCQLKWSENTKSSQYKLQVAHDDSFTNFILDTILLQNQLTDSKLDYLKTYYWRVKSFIGVDSSGWSPVWKFTTLMDSVKLISPSDLSANLELNQNFNWEKGIYEKNYRLQVAKDNDFTNMVFDTLQNQKNNTEIKNLKNYTKYFWRVRNESDDTLGYWSEIWQYRTRMTDVILIYPENEKTGLDQKIKFTWSSVFGAEYYQLQISKNVQFTDIVYSEDSIQATEHNVPDFEPNKLYYWRVRPWNKESIGTLLWSEVWTFRTGETGVKDESEYIKIIPNPAGDFITITLERWSPSSRWTPSSTDVIQIYNTLGEKVISVGTGRDLSVRINIANLPKGMYFVKVGGETKKFVKM